MQQLPIDYIRYNVVPPLLSRLWHVAKSYSDVTSGSEISFSSIFHEVSLSSVHLGESNVYIRTFTSITPLRPTISPSAFRPLLQTSTPVCGSSTEVLDLMPKISSHPALGSLQIRCGPRRTFDPSHFVRKRRHGFLSRIRTRKGRMILQRRKAKGRSTLSH